MKASVSNVVTWTLIALLLGGAIVMAFLENGDVMPTGEPAPDFTFEKWAGGQVSRADLAGKVVVLDFWATWCPPCREEMPFLVKIAKDYEAKGVAFVAVSRDEPETARAAVQRYLEHEVGELAPYVAFSDTGTRFPVRALPTIFILSRDGKILASRTGSVSERQVRRWLDEALKL